MKSLKISIITLLFSGITISCVAQTEAKPKFVFKDRFISSGGLFFSQQTISTQNNYAGLSFSPQLNLLNNFSDFSVAFGSQLDVGYKLSSADNSKLTTSIPALITVNIGHLASRDFYSTFGIFAGGGYDFCFINGELKQGLMWSAGLRTWVLKKSFTLRFSQLALNEGKIVMNIFSLELNLGDYLKQVYKNNQLSHFVKPMHR